MDSVQILSKTKKMANQQGVWVEALDKLMYMVFFETPDEFGETEITVEHHATVWREDGKVWAFFPRMCEKMDYGHTTKFWAKQQVESYLKSPMLP